MISTFVFLRRTALVLTICAAVGGCDPGGSVADGSAPSAATGASACEGGYAVGQSNVLQTFCDGTGVVRLTVNGQAAEIRGGTCAVVAGMYTFNAGVVLTPGFAGPQPDYFGFASDVQSGAFSNQTISGSIGGEYVLMVPNSGDIGPDGGSFSAGGGSGPVVEGTFTCG